MSYVAHFASTDVISRRGAGNLVPLVKVRIGQAFSRIMIEDRGPARYGFYGRTRILHSVEELLETAEAERGGTIMMIQGPPGAGKTALLHECGTKVAQKRKWRTVSIKPRALFMPSVLARAGGMSAAVGETREGQAGTDVGIKVAGLGEISARGGGLRSRAYAGEFILDILKKLAKGRRGVLLVLDEAQTLKALAQGGDAEWIATETLTMIHNGECDVPVVLLAGGLGHTRAAFAQLGISRFKADGVINLGALKPEAATGMIQSYLIRGAGVRPDAEGFAAYVKAILGRCHGWPQHLAAYGHVAVEALRGDPEGSISSPRVLQGTLQKGDRLREAYYQGRATGLVMRDRALLGALTAWRGKEAHWGRVDLEEILATQGRQEGVTAASVVDAAIAKGILTERDGMYHIPIPSMEDWLVAQYEAYVRDYPARSPKLAAGLEKILGPPRQLLPSGSGVERPPD